jgi:hypothetical protein
MATQYKSKADILTIFHQTTNKAFIDRLPDNISKVENMRVRGNQAKNKIKKEILNEIITPFYKLSGLQFGEENIDFMKKSRVIDSTKKFLFNELSDQSNVSEQIGKNNKVYISVNLSKFSVDVPNLEDIFKYLSEHKMHPNPQELIDSMDYDKSILIFDITKEETQYYLKYKSDNVYFFLRTYSLPDKEISYYPIYNLNINEPEKSNFIHTLEDTVNILPESFPNRENLLSVIEEKKGVEDKDPVEDDDPVEEEDTTVVEEEDATVVEEEDATVAGQEESKEEHVVEEAESEVEPSSMELLSNPYDNNQHLRVIQFEEYPEKTYLQGRAKYDSSITEYNIYENVENNRLVGLMKYNTAENSINVQWCKYYNPLK